MPEFHTRARAYEKKHLAEWFGQVPENLILQGRLINRGASWSCA